jgi:hypothetical protein
VPTFADIGFHVVGVMNPYDRNPGFLYRSSYFFFQVAPQLYSQGSVDPVPDSLLFRKSGKFSSNLTGSTIHLCYVARNSDHYTTEVFFAVYFSLKNDPYRIMMYGVV